MAWKITTTLDNVFQLSNSSCAVFQVVEKDARAKQPFAVNAFFTTILNTHRLNDTQLRRRVINEIIRAEIDMFW